VSVGTGGLMVVVPAVTAAVAAPLLTLGSARLERRTVLVGLSALVLVSDVIGGEGWAAGLRLAAISLAGYNDPERFSRSSPGAIARSPST
jgi:predicted MFS family arabinose efflux permease